MSIPCRLLHGITPGVMSLAAESDRETCLMHGDPGGAVVLICSPPAFVELIIFNLNVCVAVF